MMNDCKKKLTATGAGITCAVLFSAVVFPGCWRARGLDERVFQGETQGTTYTVRIVAEAVSEEESKRAAAAIEETLALIDRLMSTYRPDSRISEFNRTQSVAPFHVEPDIIEVLRVAQEVYDASGGAFDVTVGPLVRAWGFGPEGLPQPPPPEELERLRQQVGFQALEIDASQRMIRKARPDVMIDLSGIAQGYTVDKLALALDALGFENYMIEIGGEVKARGRNARGIPWRIGVERPLAGSREIHLVLPVSDVAVSTSGDYRRYREVGGVRVSHMIDPRTGRPIQHGLASVTIVHESCTVADAFCTAVMVLGPEEGYKLAVEQELAALLLVHAEDTFSEVRTPRFTAFLDGSGTPPGVPER